VLTDIAWTLLVIMLEISALVGFVCFAVWVMWLVFHERKGPK
jgi:hypothetical protein